MNAHKPRAPRDKVTRRAFLQTTVAASASLALAACGAPQSSSSDATDGATPITISLWTHDNLYAQFFTARGNEWKQSHPEYNITFDFQQVPEVFTKVLANLAAGLPVPDLIGFERGAFPQFMQGDIIEQKFVDLTPRIGDERSKFVEGAWAKYMHKGKIFGVESGLSASVFFYQPELLAKVGAEAPTTWEEAAQIGEALAAQGVALMSVDGQGSGVFMELFWQRGGNFFDQAGNFVFNSPEIREIALEVLGYMRNGVDKGFIRPFSDADFWGPPVFAAYQDGSVAGIVAPEWYSEAQLKASAEGMTGKWRMAPIPRWNDTTPATSTWGGTGFAIYQGTNNVDLVWDLLHYTYMTKESQIKRYEELKYFPTMYEALEDPRISGVTDAYYGGQQIGQLFTDLAPDVPVWYQAPAMAPLISALNTNLNRLYTQQIGADEAYATIVATTEREARYL